jgi:hypothetical protein
MRYVADHLSSSRKWIAAPGLPGMLLFSGDSKESMPREKDLCARLLFVSP